MFVKKTLLQNINSLSKNNILIKNGKKLKIIEFKMDKKSLKFCILPDFNSIKYSDFNSRFYHYLNKNILNLNPNNNKIIDLFLTLNKKLILEKKENILMNNKDLDLFKINS
jgi:hypothetical protein